MEGESHQVALGYHSSVEEQAAAVRLVEGREAIDAIEKTNVLRFKIFFLFTNLWMNSNIKPPNPIIKIHLN